MKYLSSMLLDTDLMKIYLSGIPCDNNSDITRDMYLDKFKFVIYTHKFNDRISDLSKIDMEIESGVVVNDIREYINNKGL